MKSAFKKVHDYINSLITSGIYIIHDKIQLFINIDYVMFNRMFLILPLFFISIYFIRKCLKTWRSAK